MAMTTACLSGGGNNTSGGGGGAPSGQASGSTVTIWTSIDQPVMDGLKAGLDADGAGKRASRSSGQKVDNINQLIMTKIQAERRA